MPENISIVRAAEVNEQLYEDILVKITALCRGFLLVADKSPEKACSFCRGFLVLAEQLSDIMTKVKQAKNT